MKTKLTSILFLALAVNAGAQPWTWQPEKELLEAKLGHTAAILDDKIYFIRGALEVPADARFRVRSIRRVRLVSGSRIGA